MAPPLAARAETTPSLLRPSSPLMEGLGSVAPLVLLILLLLLCFPGFKRKKRQFFTNTLKQDINTSELIRMTKLEDGPHPAEMSLPGGNLHTGGPWPSRQAERQTSGVAAADRQPGSPAARKDSPCTVGPNHPGPEKPTVSSSDHLETCLGLQATHPNASAPPGLLQLRKLPVTPKEAHISPAEPQSLSTDSQVYESIRGEERELCARGWSEGPELPARATSRFTTGSARSGEKATAGTLAQPSAMSAQLAVALQHSAPPPQQQLLEVTSEKEASDPEERLSAMYARVCRKPKGAAQPWQPADHDRPASREEDESPPPIPEKQFEHLYESLRINTERQGGSMPNATTPPDAWTGAGKGQTSKQTAIPLSC